ncbi:MAG TPA: DNA polymerase III subunit beta [Bacteroidales bacterium]|nr:DNA polymerase III subunit beta [Bacteroidales bacterium]
MKFIVSTSVLLKNLQAISGVLTSSNTLPILDNFLFDLTDEKLSVTASDLETTITVVIPVTMAENDGIIAVPARYLIDILKTFPDVPMSFTINNETFQIEISAGEGKYKLTGFNGDVYPQSPVVDNGTSISLDSQVLVNAFNKTLFATGNDEMRIVMTGVFCQLSDKDITFVATDAHKLVRYRRTDAGSSEPGSFVLPKKPLNLIKNILSSLDVPVKIEYNNTNALFEFENIRMICRLIDGKYPNYEAVIPANNNKKLTINRQQILTSIKRVSIFSNQLTRQIRFSITGQELILSAEDAELSNEAKERLSCNYAGDDIDIGFNSKFILEMINNLDTEEICIEMSASNRAALLFPVIKNEGEDILMLVMPVMLNQ